MTAVEFSFVLAGLLALVGIHQVISKLLKLLDGHLERFQSKFDVMMISQTEHNKKIDAILRKLF